MLRACYAPLGATSYGAMHALQPPLRATSYCVQCACYAVSGTSIADAIACCALATRCAVLRSRMLMYAATRSGARHCRCYALSPYAISLCYLPMLSP
eukprot:3581788-Rhodomonas_salina.1